MERGNNVSHTLNMVTGTEGSERAEHLFDILIKTRTPKCKVYVTYMLGYGENYALFLPSDVIMCRFLDEYDLDFSDLVRSVEKIRSSCP